MKAQLVKWGFKASDSGPCRTREWTEEVTGIFCPELEVLICEQGGEAYFFRARPLSEGLWHVEQRHQWETSAFIEFPSHSWKPEVIGEVEVPDEFLASAAIFAMHADGIRIAKRRLAVLLRHHKFGEPVDKE